MNNFNLKHPELINKDEIFIINIKNGEENLFNNIEIFVSTRIGKTAYDNNGKIVNSYKPLFGIPKKKI